MTRGSALVTRPGEGLSIGSEGRETASWRAGMEPWQIGAVLLLVLVAAVATILRARRR